MSDHAVEVRHTPECSERIVFGGECSCEPDLWVRLSDVIDALRAHGEAGAPGDFEWGMFFGVAADFIEREFGGES